MFSIIIPLFNEDKNIKPEEGSLLIFRGAKSLHGSGNLLKNTKRVTMLYHFKKI